MKIAFIEFLYDESYKGLEKKVNLLIDEKEKLGFECIGINYLDGRDNDSDINVYVHFQIDKNDYGVRDDK